MKIYLITDTHFGHDKMVEYCGRPPTHSEMILDRLAIIPEHQLLIHLGDICIGKDAEWHERMMKWKPAGAKWILVRGNHDHKGNAWYYDHGWDFVCDSFVIQDQKKKILFSHAPQQRVADTDFNIHGHWHNNDHRGAECPFYDPSYHLKLAIEEVGYRPIHLLRFLGDKGIDK